MTCTAKSLSVAQGSAGLRQRVVQRLREQTDADACDLPINELRPRIHAVVNSVQKEAVDEHVAIADGPPALVSFLFAGVTEGHGWIYEIAVDGSDQVHDIAEAIGEARHYAMYGMVHNSDYQHQERPMKQIRMLAYRIVDTAIRTDASGSLGLGDIEVYEVTASGAVALTLDEKQAMGDALGAWREQERRPFRWPRGRRACVRRGARSRIGLIVVATAAVVEARGGTNQGHLSREQDCRSSFVFAQSDPLTRKNAKTTVPTKIGVNRTAS